MQQEQDQAVSQDAELASDPLASSSPPPGNLPGEEWSASAAPPQQGVYVWRWGVDISNTSLMGVTFFVVFFLFRDQQHFYIHHLFVILFLFILKLSLVLIVT